MIRRVLIVVVSTLLMAIAGCGAQVEEGVRVSGTPSHGSWPLKDFSEGTIICRGWPPTKPATRPIVIPFIFLKTSTGELFALNGKAMTAARNGKVQARVLRDELQRSSADVELFLVMGKWVNVGTALCKGDTTEAARLAAEADRMAAE
jgi:hypothetical protein